MAVCKSCSAPLLPNSNFCQYCGVRNDVDLQDKQDVIEQVQQSSCICPNCHKPLQTIDLKINGNFYLDRCDTCFGLFFKPGKIETLLEHAVTGVFNANWQWLDNINQERYPHHQKVRYVKCPVCQVLMNRVNFAYRSGVVVDQCSAHGIWLDNGEITHLMEWKKAGGELLQEQHRQEEKTAQADLNYALNHNSRPHHPYPQFENDSEPDFLTTLAMLTDKFMR